MISMDDGFLLDGKMLSCLLAFDDSSNLAFTCMRKSKSNDKTINTRYVAFV